MTRRQAVYLLIGAAVVVFFAVGAWYIFLHHSAHDNDDTRNRAMPVIFVEAVYPGANAQVVADTVAAPIEQEINGVEGMQYMVSHSGSDGSYTLEIAFQPGTNHDIAQVLVQNRVSLAHPKLPEFVKLQGVSVKKRQPSPLLLITLTAKENRYTDSFLTNYAHQKIKDELLHVTGVGDIGIIGPHDKGAGRDGFAILNGVPSAVLVLWPLSPGRAKTVSADIENALEQLRKDLPEGAILELSFDFAPFVEGAPTADDLIVDVQMPDAASSERTRDVLRRCEALLQKTPGVKDVLSLSENPFDLSSERACQVVRLAPDGKQSRDDLLATIRRQFHQEIAEAAIQLRDLSGPRRFPFCAYPIDLAVQDTKELGLEALQREADALAQRLGQSPKLADAMARFRANVPQVASGPQAIMRYNMYTMAEITANPAPGVSLTEAREECERIARDTLATAYRVGWLSRIATAR